MSRWMNTSRLNSGSSRTITASDFALFNLDDDRVAALRQRVRAKRLGFTTASTIGADLSGGTYLEDDVIVTTLPGYGRRFVVEARSESSAATNVENVMAAATYAVLCGCPLDAIRRVLATFPGLEHALEIVRERRGVRFVNDSKGTNVDATLKALESNRSTDLAHCRRTVNKGGDFSRLAQAVSRRVTRVILIGEAAPFLRQAWEGVATMTEAATLRDAVDLAAQGASPGDVVLLSPACASFDMFGYQDRGRQFKALVHALPGVTCKAREERF